jgi:hypothetical protein
MLDVLQITHLLFRLCRRLYKSDCSLQASLHSLAPSLSPQPSLGPRELIGKEP